MLYNVKYRMVNYTMWNIDRNRSNCINYTYTDMTGFFAFMVIIDCWNPDRSV